MTDNEFKFWAENYPEEAETIVTLCDLFDQTQDEATKAQLAYVIGILRQKEEKKKMSENNKAQTIKFYCPFRKESYMTTFGYGGSNDNYPSETKTYEEFLPCLGEECMLYSTEHHTCSFYKA